MRRAGTCSLAPPLQGNVGTSSRQAPTHRPAPAALWRREPRSLTTFPRSQQPRGQAALSPRPRHRACAACRGAGRAGPRQSCQGCEPLGHANTCRCAAPAQGGEEAPAPSRAELCRAVPHSVPSRCRGRSSAGLSAGMERSARHRARKQPRRRGAGSSARVLPGAEDGVVLLCEDVPAATERLEAASVSGSIYSVHSTLRLKEL